MKVPKQINEYQLKNAFTRVKFDQKYMKVLFGYKLHWLFSSKNAGCPFLSKALADYCSML